MSKVNKTAAGLFAILLGNIGVHKFYMGKTLAGLIEGILYLTEEDDDFYSRLSK